MWTIYLFIALGIIYSIWHNHDGYGDFVDYAFGIFLGVICGGVMGFCVAWMLPMELYEKQDKFKIVSLQDGSNVKGDFFLGCGTIEGKMQYVFYYECDGMYRMAQVDYNKVAIKYTDKEPIANMYTMTATDAFINHFAGDIDEGDKRFVIEVPRGTIQSQYNLDAK